MQMTGHKTCSVFERYNIVSETDFADAVRRLDERHGQSLGSSTGGWGRRLYADFIFY